MKLSFSNFLSILASIALVLSIIGGATEIVGKDVAGWCLLASAVATALTKSLPEALKGVGADSSKTTSLILLVAFACSLNVGCDASEEDFKKAFRASEQIAGFGAQATRTIGDLYRAGVIDKELTEKIVNKLEIVAKNSQRFHNAIRDTKAAFGANFPDKEVNALDIVFNREVIAPLVEILTEAGLLSETAGKQVLTALVFIKQAILLVAQFFGKLRPGQSASYEFYFKNQEVLTANV